MAHFASGTWALFDEDVQNYLGTTGVQFMSYDRYDKTSHNDAFGSTFITVGNALNAREVWSARGNMPTIHLMGGTIMGTEAGNSVTNSYGQTHELANLHVAGSGLFPTAGA